MGLRLMQSMSNYARTYTLSSSPAVIVVIGLFVAIVGVCIIYYLGRPGNARPARQEGRSHNAREDQRQALSNMATAIVGYGMSAMGIIALIAGIAHLI